MTPRSAPHLLAALTARTRANLTAAGQLRQATEAQLTSKPHEKAWNAVECLEHLNRYGDIYLPEIERRLFAKEYPAAATFTSSWLGNKIAAGMKPGPKTRRVKTFPSKNPLGMQVDRRVIDIFIEQQEWTLRLLEEAASADLTRVKTKTSLPLLKLRLGDTLRTLVYHNWRHVDQALRAAGMAD